MQIIDDDEIIPNVAGKASSPVDSWIRREEAFANKRKAEDTARDQLATDKAAESEKEANTLVKDFYNHESVNGR